MAHFLANRRSWTASESTPQTAWKIGTCISQVTASRLEKYREMRWHELNGLSIINYPFGVPIYGNPHIKWIEMTPHHPHRLKTPWDLKSTRPRGPEFPGQTLESKNRLPGRPRSNHEGYGYHMLSLPQPVFLTTYILSTWFCLPQRLLTGSCLLL